MMHTADKEVILCVARRNWVSEVQQVQFLDQPKHGRTYLSRLVEVLVGAMQQNGSCCAQDGQNGGTGEGSVLTAPTPIQQQVASFGDMLLKVFIEVIEQGHPGLEVSLQDIDPLLKDLHSDGEEVGAGAV